MDKRKVGLEKRGRTRKREVAEERKKNIFEPVQLAWKMEIFII